MDNLFIMLQEKKEELELMVERSKEFLEKAPDGKLYIKKNKGKIQYYCKNILRDKKNKYIRKGEKEYISLLAQKEYEKAILKDGLQLLKILNQFLIEYQSNQIKDVYQNMSCEKKELIKPYVLPDEEFVQKWKNEKMRMIEEQGKDDLSLLSEEDVIFTECGERVRSKSEKIIADLLFYMGIPYVYECPFYVKGYGYVYPDFTILNVRTRQEFIWEHLGLMDNAGYCEKAIKKVESFEKNDLMYGERLIITCETKNHPINIKLAKQKIRKFLL